MNHSETRYILQRVVCVGPIPVVVEYEATKDKEDCYHLVDIREAYVEDEARDGVKVDVLVHFMGADYEWLERQLDPDTDEIIDKYEYSYYDGPES